MLLKFYPTSGLMSRPNGIMEWLDSHCRCHPRSYEMDLGDDPGFTLHTEVGFLDGSLDMEKQNREGVKIQ